ncbi:MAG: hypothetical protein H7281_07895 [Bacteriovorax sp.]|nr:hypothetical protein [Bacteriovorax sp.]
MPYGTIPNMPEIDEINKVKPQRIPSTLDPDQDKVEEEIYEGIFIIEDPLY